MRILAGLLLAVLPLPQGHAQDAASQDAAALRGGWVATDGIGRTSIYLLVVRGSVVTGTECSDCADPRDLGFIIDGRIDGAGVRFRILHRYPDEHVTLDEVRGAVHGAQLLLTVQGADRGETHQRTQVLRRPAPLPALAPATPQGVAYVPPAAPEPLTVAGLEGLWLAGTGPRKQYFIIRQTGLGLLGLACGPCDDPATMAPLDGFAIHGTDLKFDIVHEGTGDPGQRAPFRNVVHATLSRHELHLRAIPSDAPPDSRPFEMTLLGPVTLEPP